MSNQLVLLTDPTKIYHDAPESVFGLEFRNDYGAIRCCYVRDKYRYHDICKSDVVDIYKEWRDDAEFFILRGLTYSGYDQERIIAKPDAWDQWFLEDELSYVYKFVKASKRGNDVYQHLVSEKLKPLTELENLTFFKDDWSCTKSSSMLFITLTYDTKRCNSDTAWKNIGSEFHLFCNNLRKHYKSKIEFFRVWESTQNFYPHIHVLMGFKNHSFEVFTHKDKSGAVSYRIPWNDVKTIGKYWHSNVDVQAIDSTQGAIRELTKYVTKDLCSDKGDKTNAMIWVHGKQGYSITRGFTKMIDNQFADVDVSEPTNDDLINQMCNCNRDVVFWEFVGILRACQLGFSRDLWVVECKKPPPRVVDLVLNEWRRWRSLH